MSNIKKPRPSRSKSSKPFCPRPARCFDELSSKNQPGGNPPPPLVSSTANPTTRGNLLHRIIIKNNSVDFINAVGSVLAVFRLYGDIYTYHLPWDAYHKIKRIDDDCWSLYGGQISMRRCLRLCDKYCYRESDLRDLFLS